MGVVGQLKRLPIDDRNVNSGKHLGVEGAVDAWCSGYDGSVVGVAQGCFDHNGQVVFDFLDARARHKGYYGLGGIAAVGSEKLLAAAEVA